MATEEMANDERELAFSDALHKLVSEDQVPIHLLYELSDLNDDETVDGFDIQILEDYIDGKNLIQTPRKLRYLQVYVQNLLPADVYPVVFQDLLGTGTATIATDSIQFAVTKPEEA